MIINDIFKTILMSSFFVQLHRVSSDVDRLQESTSRYKTSLDLKERQLGETKEKERQVDIRFLDCQGQLKDANDECKRLTGLLAERDNRYNHETKRMENETNRLKERLCKLLGERVNTTYVNEYAKGNKFNSTPAWIEMTSLICNPKGKSRGKWRTDISEQRKEELLAQRIIQDHEDKQAKLVNENSELRESYFNFQYELVRILNEQCVLEKDRQDTLENSIEETEGRENLDSSVLLPLDISREELIDTSEKLIQNIRDILKQRNNKIERFDGLINDYKTWIGSSTAASDTTEDAIKFILNHKQTLQEQEEKCHLQKNMFAQQICRCHIWCVNKLNFTVICLY